MLKHFFKNETTGPVDEQIAKILIEMDNIGVTAPEYPTMMAYLERLYEVKAKERPKPVNRETIALVAGNLLGILVIVAYEQKHVMTSKGFSQIIRPRND